MLGVDILFMRTVAKGSAVRSEVGHRRMVTSSVVAVIGVDRCGTRARHKKLS